jgi:hypothetical protein
VSIIEFMPEGEVNYSLGIILEKSFGVARNGIGSDFTTRLGREYYRIT